MQTTRLTSFCAQRRVIVCVCCLVFSIEDVFIHTVPPCAGDRLLSYDSSYKGSPTREKLYASLEWAIELTQRLHARLSEAGGASESEASLFYVPAFFALLIALHDAPSLECLAMSLRMLSTHSAFQRNAGYDHFYVHGLEHPLSTAYDYALAVGRSSEEEASALVNAFYATVQNVAIVATGDLSQGTLSAALGGSLYGMRRVINVPFLFHEPCWSAAVLASTPRDLHVTFVGNIQSYNYERMQFFKALSAEFSGYVSEESSGLTYIQHAKVYVQARVIIDPKSVQLNASERAWASVDRQSIIDLYRRSQLCVVAPGDHGGILGQRLSDILVAGCVPVVLQSPGSYPVLPLRGSIPWEDFVIVLHLGDDTTTARWAVRKLLALNEKKITLRRDALLRWRPRLALGRDSKICDGSEVPDAADLVLDELRALQRIWQHQLLGSSLELNASGCKRLGYASLRCGALRSMLPIW